MTSDFPRARGAVFLALLISCAAAAPVCATQQRPAEVATEAVPLDPVALVAQLDAPSEVARQRALAELLAADPDACALAFAAPLPKTVAGQRTFARFVARSGQAHGIARLIELARHADAVVRREAVAGLGRVDLGPHAVAQRVEALSVAARNDSEVAVRRAAIAALGGIEDAAAARELSELVLRGDEFAAPAAQALAGLASGAAELAHLLERCVLGSERAPEGGAVLSALLDSYGPALARGHSAPAVGARVLSAFGLSSDAEVQSAATRALDEALVEWDRLDTGDAAALFLDRLSAAGWSPDALDTAVAQRALAEDGQPNLALAAGERLIRRHRATEGVAGARHVASGLVFEACAQLVLERRAEARESLARAAEVLEGALEARPELATRPFRLQSGRADLAVDLWQRLAAVRVLALFERIASGVDPLSDEALELARRAHVAALEAQLVAYEGDSDVYASNWEAVLGASLAPRVLLAPSARGEGALDWLELHGATYASLAAVAPAELPGFLGALPDNDGAAQWQAVHDRRPELVDPLADPQRLALLRALRVADVERVARRASDPDELRNRILWERVQQNLMESLASDEERGFAPLLEYRGVCTMALSHASDLRSVGASDRALVHALATRAEVKDSPTAPTGSQGAWFGARVALAIGAACTDVGEGARAARELLDAHDRLVALENELDSALAEFDAGRRGLLVLDSTDPSDRRRLVNERESTRLLRAQVLVSLAVNSNVRLHDLAAARTWFERAYELRQDDFMRVLFACYAARAGRADEARFALASVAPAPELDYNLACTHALLGDVERALVYLERALEALDTRGARVRQARWAADDPDFAPLQSDPRFKAVLDRFGS